MEDIKRTLITLLNQREAIAEELATLWARHATVGTERSLAHKLHYEPVRTALLHAEEQRIGLPIDDKHLGEVLARAPQAQALTRAWEEGRAQYKLLSQRAWVCEQRIRLCFAMLQATDRTEPAEAIDRETTSRGDDE